MDADDTQILEDARIFPRRFENPGRARGDKLAVVAPMPVPSDMFTQVPLKGIDVAQEAPLHLSWRRCPHSTAASNPPPLALACSLVASLIDCEATCAWALTSAASSASLRRASLLGRPSPDSPAAPEILRAPAAQPVPAARAWPAAGAHPTPPPRPPAAEPAPLGPGRAGSCAQAPPRQSPGGRHSPPAEEEAAAASRLRMRSDAAASS